MIWVLFYEMIDACFIYIADFSGSVESLFSIVKYSEKIFCQLSLLV